MLEQFRETPITWDKASRKVYEPLRASAGDNKGRKLSVQVVNGGVIESLSGASLSLFWETKDKAHKGLDAFDPVDATKGEFEIYYTTGMLSNEGTLNANLVLVDASGRVVSEPFTITVFKGIDDDAIQSSDSFTALTEALAQVGNINNKADRAELLALESTFEQNKVSVEQQLQQLDGQKADISYVDQSISTMTNGAIKGTYTTFSALKTAYPQGAVGPFLVEETQLRYIWDVNKLEWVSIGPYEPAEIQEKSITSDLLALEAVKAENIAPKAVTNGRLGDGVVNTRVLADGAITNENIAPSTIGGDKLAIRGVTNGRLALKAVDRAILSDSYASAGFIAAGTDLNDLKLHGIYLKESATLVLNAPPALANGQILLCNNVFSSSILIQIAMELRNPTNAYIRYISVSGLGEWEPLFSSGEKGYDQSLNTTDNVQFSSVKTDAIELSGEMPTGTLVSPPPGVIPGDMWADTTDSTTNPIVRVMV